MAARPSTPETSSTRTAIAETALVDTNVLIDATNTRRPHHDDALAVLESGTALVLSAQVIREYLVVATRPPGVNGLGMTMATALDNIRAFRREIRLLPEERPVLPTFLALLERSPCSGKRIHDGHLVATTIAHDVHTIVSLNPDDFSAFRDDIAVVTPRDVLRRHGSAWHEPPRAWRRGRATSRAAARIIR